MVIGLVVLLIYVAYVKICKNRKRRTAHIAGLKWTVNPNEHTKDCPFPQQIPKGWACPVCGREVDDDAHYCKYCGQAICDD